jgi:hypothetical protein
MKKLLALGLISGMALTACTEEQTATQQVVTEPESAPEETQPEIVEETTPVAEVETAKSYSATFTKVTQLGSYEMPNGGYNYIKEIRYSVRDVVLQDDTLLDYTEET